MRLEHYLVGGYVRYISPLIIINQPGLFWAMKIVKINSRFKFIL